MLIPWLPIWLVGRPWYVHSLRLMLVFSNKPLDPISDIYDGHNADLETKVGIWIIIDVISVE